MNAKLPPRFQRPPFPQQAPQKSNIEAMIESMLLTQQRLDEYTKQLTSKVYVISTHNKMLEAQIAEEISSSSTLPSKPKLNPREQCNATIMRG